MLFKLKIVFNHPCLSASGPSDENSGDACIFERAQSGKISLPPEAWAAAIKQAFMQLNIPHSSAAINIDREVEAQTIQYRRTYNKRSSRLHEAVPTKQEVVFDGMTFKENEDGEPFTVEQLCTIFSVIGKHIGITLWGKKHGYGKFTVVSVEPVRSQWDGKPSGDQAS